MKRTLLNIATLTALTIGLAGCGGGGGGSAPTNTGESTTPTTPTTPTTTTITLSGTAIDGLIKSATVCIDTNQNNLCDSGEPTTTTDINGNYSFDVAQNSGTKNIIVIGGIDTATNSEFTGILKEKVSIESSPISSINITPLTTTATLLADEQNVTIASAKQTIATKLGLTSSDISKNPLTDVAVYKKTQEIVQATKVLQSQIQKDDTNQINNQKAFEHIIKQIALTLKDSTTTGTLNIDTLATKLETTTYNNQAVVIPSEVKTFTADYIAEVNTKLASVNTTTNLNNIQNGLEIHTNTAKTNIKNNQTSTLSSTLSSFVAQSTATIAENGSNGFFGDDGTPTPITPTNQKPVATFTSFTTDEDTAYNGTLTATDADVNTLTYSKVSNPSHGVVTVNTNGTFTYTPTADYFGADSFSYKVNDGTIDSLTKTVSITVNSVVDIPTNQKPLATFTSFTTDEDTAYNGTLTATDADGNTLTYSKVSNPSHGVVTVNTNGIFTYTPTADYFGTDSFSYKVNDGTIDSLTKTVSITVNSVNDAPIVSNKSISTSKGIIESFKITATDSDSTNLVYTLKTSPTFGTLEISTIGNATFKSGDNEGETTAIATVSDGTTSKDINITFNVTSFDINKAISVCDSYKSGYNSLQVENGLIKIYSDLTINFTNYLENNITIHSAKLYNGDTLKKDVVSNYELAPNSILKLTVDYPSTAISLDNYWIIQFTEHFTGKSYIAKYQYDSLVGNTITSSKSINSTSLIGCYDDSYLKGSVSLALDLGFEITPIEDATISSSVKVPVQFNASIIDNDAIISFDITPQTGLSASYQDGNITLTTNPNETIANDYNVTILAKSGVNQASQTFKVSYVNEINVSNTSELRTALQTAAQNGRNDIIRLADGIYMGGFSFIDSEPYDLHLIGSSIRNVILDGNNAHSVLYLYNTQTTPSFHLENLTVQNGYLESGNGAGINSNRNIYLKSVAIKNNKANGSSRGGGLYVSGGYTNVNLNILNSIIENNEAGSGGGFYSNSISGIVEIENSIIRDNTFTYQGGGFYAWNANIYNSIIVSNKLSNVPLMLAQEGGAFYCAKPFNISNSIIMNNVSGIFGHLVYDNKFIVNSILSNNGTYDIKSTSTIQIINSYLNGIILSPFFEINNISTGNLGFVDEVNGDYRLTADSVLRNAGTSLADGVVIPTTDFDGNPRKSGTEVDIGPFEYQEN